MRTAVLLTPQRRLVLPTTTRRPPDSTRFRRAGDLGPAAFERRCRRKRYVLTFYLSQHGPTSIADLIDVMGYYNFAVAEPRSKTISDALRWEIAHGRVVRLRRGLYGPGEIPRATEHRIRTRVLALRAEADILAGRDWDAWWDALAANGR